MLIFIEYFSTYFQDMYCTVTPSYLKNYKRDIFHLQNVSDHMRSLIDLKELFNLLEFCFIMVYSPREHKASICLETTSASIKASTVFFWDHHSIRSSRKHRNIHSSREHHSINPFIENHSSNFSIGHHSDIFWWAPQHPLLREHHSIHLLESTAASISLRPPSQLEHSFLKK